jgi:cell division protein FtsB
VLENFLEEESQKKEQEIRKLKEEAIVKEKNHKMLKAENSQLLSEVSALKDELASKAQIAIDSSNDKVNELQDFVAKSTREH